MAELGPGIEAETVWFTRANQRTTKATMYGHPRYMAYVAKWRSLYRPWVRRRRGGVRV